MKSRTCPIPATQSTSEEEAVPDSQRMSSLEAITEAIACLPGLTGRVPNADDVRLLLQARSVAEPMLLERLDQPLPERRNYRGAVRNGWIATVLGEWRSRDAIPALVRLLGCAHVHGEEHILHALTRIGPHAITPLLFLLFDREAPLAARCRAVRTLASVGVAAEEHGGHARWPGDPAAQWREICAALRLVLARERTESAELVWAAAQGLCDLRCEEAWADIRALHAVGRLEVDEACCIDLLEMTMAGEITDFELGGWDTSLLQWML